MEVEWTMEKTLQLIEQIAMRPAIWKFTPKDYKNRVVIQKRLDALKEVGNYFNTTTKQIEHKLGILRAQYSREKVKMIKSRKSAVNEEDVYETRWFAFKPMSFIMMQRRQHDYSYGENDQCLTMDDTTTAHDDNSSFNKFRISNVESLINNEKQLKLDSDSVTCEPTTPETIEELNYPDDHFDMEPTCSTMTRISSQEEQPAANNFEKDEFVIFGESISWQLRNLKTKYGKSLAKLNIQKAIFDAELWEEKNYPTNISQHARPDTRPT